jgi:hypothetical protein
MRLIAIASLMAGCAFRTRRQNRLCLPQTRKNAEAPSAGPTFITKDTTLLDGPSSPNGEDRFSGKVRTNGTCLPSIPGYPHDEPGRFDRVYFQWLKDSMDGRAPHIDRSESHICMALPSASFIRALLSSISVPT